MRMARGREILKSHFADDPAAAGKIDRDVFEDLIYIEAAEGKKDISVAQIEYLIELFAQKPFASTGKAAIIADGERMNEQAQNKLLKLLEEPASGDVILILTANSERLLPTIRSRCIRVWLGYERPQTDAESAERVKELVRMLVFGKATLPEAFALLDACGGDRETAARLLKQLELFLRDLAVGSFEPRLLTDTDFAGAAANIGAGHRAVIRGGIGFAEKALANLEQGYNVKSTLRDMALCIKERAESVE